MSIEPPTKRGLRPWTRLPWSCSIRKNTARHSSNDEEVAKHRKDHVEEKRDLNATSKERDGPSWAGCLMSDVELRSNRSNFTTCKISEAFKLHQKSKRARHSESEGKKERKTVLKEISMHTFVWVHLARIETFFFSASDYDHYFTRPSHAGRLGRLGPPHFFSFFFFFFF